MSTGRPGSVRNTSQPGRIQMPKTIPVPGSVKYISVQEGQVQSKYQFRKARLSGSVKNINISSGRSGSVKNSSSRRSDSVRNTSVQKSQIQ